MDAHWLGIFSHCACRVVIFVGLIFAYLQVQDSMDMKQIFMSIKYQAATNLTLLLK